MNADLIRRLISNQSAEHTPHAFRAGGVGMAEFKQLHQELSTVPLRELARWMKLVDQMRLTHEHCEPCNAKILAFCVAFTEGRLPALEKKYARLYAAQMRTSRQGRDYRMEVLAALSGGPEAAAALVYKKFWKGAATDFALSKPAQGD